MTVDQLKHLASQLKPLSLNKSTPLCEEQRLFLDFYTLPLPSEYKYSTGYIKVNELRICAHVWQPEEFRQTVIIVHGYFDHTGLYGHIIRFFLERSYTVMVFDLPGHGLSSGERAHISNFSEYSVVLRHCIEWAHKTLPPVTCLFGQSTGAAVIINTLVVEKDCQDYEEKICRIVLFAPLVKVPGWYLIWFFYRLISPFVSQIKRKRTKNSHDRNFLSLLDKDPLQPDHVSLKWVGAMYKWFGQIKKVKITKGIPVFIAQGKEDVTVDWSYNIPFIKHIFTNTRVMMLPEAYHHLVNESRDFRQQYMYQLSKWLDSL